jgi:hypothetical protein
MNSRHIRTIALTAAAILTGNQPPPPAHAGGQPVESCYFEAVITEGSRSIARPAALVKIGAEAKLHFGRTPARDDSSPKLGLRYQVQEKPRSALIATVTALVDDKEVGTRTLAFTRDKGASVTMEGGGLTWKISVDLMTPELLERKRAQKLRDREQEGQARPQ